MSAQRTKKRFGSHRRVANQSETPKTDEILATDSIDAEQHHIPEESIDTLCVLSNPDDMPSPELKANRRKLGSRRKNKGQHEKDLATELSDKPKEEVENSQVKEALETQQVKQCERQEELCESLEHEMSVSTDISSNSAITSAYCGVQSYTINSPEDSPQILNPKSENQNQDEDGDFMSSSKFVELMLKGGDESDSTRSELVKDDSLLIGSSETVLSSHRGVSCVTEREKKKWDKDSDLVQQEGNISTTDRSNTTQNTKLMCNTEPATVSSSIKELSAEEKQNEQLSLPLGSQPQDSSVSTEEHDDDNVNTTVNRRKLGSSRKNRRQRHVDDSVAEPSHETKEEETTKMSSMETAVQVHAVEMTEEIDKPDTYQTEKPPTLHQQLTNQTVQTYSLSSVINTGSEESDENSGLLRHWGALQSGNLVESTMPLAISTEKNIRQDTENEQSVEQAADSSSKHEVFPNKEDEQFSVSEVKRAQDADNPVRKEHEENVKPAATQEIPFVDYSSESVMHDGTENCEICSMNPADLTEASVKNTAACASEQDVSNADENQDMVPNVETLDQINEDLNVYDPRKTQDGDTEREDTAVDQLHEDDIKSTAEQSSEHEEEGLLSEVMKSKTLETLQPETHSPSESQPHDNSVIKDKQDNTDFSLTVNSGEPECANANEEEHNVSRSGADSKMSLMMETAVEEMSVDVQLEGHDRLEPAHTEGMSDQEKDTAPVSTSELPGTSVHSSPPVDQQAIEQPNSPVDQQAIEQPNSPVDQQAIEQPNSPVDQQAIEQPNSPVDQQAIEQPNSPVDQQAIEQPNSPVDQQAIEQPNPEKMPQEVSSVCSVTDTGSKEGDEDSDLLRQWGNLMSNNLVTITHFKSEDGESSFTPEISTEGINQEEHTEAECRVEQTTVSSPKDNVSTKDRHNEQHSVSEVRGALDSKDAVTKVYNEEIKPKETQENHITDYSTECGIHDGTEHSEICFVNLTDQTDVSDSCQPESSVKNTATCASEQDVSNADENQDMVPNVETLDQINEDLNVYDPRKTQDGDTEREDTAVDQLHEDDIKSTAEQSREHEEEGLLSEVMKSKTLETLQPETHSPSESQPHDNSVITDKQDNTDFSLTVNSGEPECANANEEEHNVSRSGADSKMSLMMETAVQDMSVDVQLEGHGRLEPAHTEGLSDQEKDTAPVSTSELTGTSVHSSPPVDQQAIEQPNSPVDQQAIEQPNSPVDQQAIEQPNPHFKSEDGESSFTPEISTEEINNEQYTEAECRVEQTTVSSPKDNMSTKDRHNVGISLQSGTEHSSSLQPNDSPQNIKENTHTGFKPAGNRRKLGSSRRHKERQHVPEFKEEVVENIQSEEVSEKEKMPSATEKIRQDILKEQSGPDFNPTEKMRKNRSSLKDKENTGQMPKEDTTSQSHDISTTMSAACNYLKSTQQVNEVEKKDLSAPADYDTLKIDLVQSAEASDLKHSDDDDSNRSVTSKVLDQKGAIQVQSTAGEEINVNLTKCSKETAEAAVIQEYNTDADRPVDLLGQSEQCEDNTSNQVRRGELFSTAQNKNATCALVDTGHDENSRPKAAVDVSEEGDVSGTPSTTNNQQGLTAELPVHGNVQGTTRKMGATHRGTTRPSVSNVTGEQQEMNENSSLCDERQKPQSCAPDLQATECNMIPGVDDSACLTPQQSAFHSEEVVHPVRFVQGAESEKKVDGCIKVTQGPGSKLTEEVRGGAGEPLQNVRPSVQERNSVTAGGQCTNFEMMNENFSPASRRRKMGSTRRNLGSRAKQKDLHQKQEVDDEGTVGDAGEVNEKELQLHGEKTRSDAEQRKERVFETVEHSRTGESHTKPSALQTVEENPGSLSRPAETEHHLTPDHLPAQPCTSQKQDVVPESAAGGRRRKMGSHRKSHRHQDAKDQTVGEDGTIDAQQGGDVGHLRDGSEESSGTVDRLSEVDKRDNKRPCDVSGTAEHSQILSEKAPDRVTPVHHPNIHLDQETQSKFSLGVSPETNVKSEHFNVLLVGDSSVGKTSFIKRAQSGKFSLDLPASIGFDSCRWTVLVDGKPVVLQLWDTAGQERFRSITRQVFHKAQAFLLMYDITSSQTFSTVSYWANCIQEGAAENVTVLLLGNKSDRAERQIKREEGETLSKEYNFEFMECSAATGENVIQTLEIVARMLKQKVDTRQEAMVLHKDPPKKRTGCC